jgi:GAF domain-containing protein
LIVGQRVLGALDVQSTQAVAFDDDSAAVLQAMADQVAIALNNANLFAEAQAVARRSHALYEASQQVSRLEADASSIIDAMMHTVSDTLGFDAWWGLLLDKRRTLLTTLAMNAAEQQWPQAVLVPGFENNPIVRSAIHGETLVINDPVNDLYLKNAPPEQRIPLKTICAPIVIRGESVGTIVFGRALDAPDMAQGDLEVAQSLASLTAIAIENSRLLSQTQRALSELDEINRRLTGETWATFTRRRSSDGVVWISNSDRRQRETHPEVEEAFTTGQVATRPIDGNGTLGVAIPINLRDATVGALQLVVPQMLWDNETVATLESIAGHIAQAAENARLIEQTQRSAQREKAIAGAADKIHRSTDLDTVLRAAVAEINRVTGLGGVSIQLGFGQSEPTDGNGHRTDADGGR